MPYWSPYAVDDFVGWPPRPVTDRHQRRRGPRRFARVDVDRDDQVKVAGWGTRMVAAFYANGWSRALTPLERSVWFALVPQADPVTGECAVSLRELAGLLRMAKESSLCKARGGLVTKGLLVALDDGGGRGKTKAVRMVMPAEAPPRRQRRPPASPPEPVPQPAPAPAAPPAIEDHEGHLWGPRP
jgi:hypothetical protein